MAGLFEREAWTADGAQRSWGEEAHFRTGRSVFKKRTPPGPGFSNPGKKDED